MPSTKKDLFFVPDPYQVEGIHWVEDNPYCGLLWDPGMGKTSTVLHAFEELIEWGEIDSLLVVATKRIASKVWPDEIAKWGLPLRVEKILGDPGKREAAMQAEAEVYVTNYENLVWLCERWSSNNFGRVMLVCDESTKLKRTQTKRFKALRPHLKKFERRCILTGTPIPNGMEDLFGQMFVVDQGASLGQFITHFRNRWFHPTGYMGYKWELNRGAEEEIYDVISDKVHRANADLLDLPDLIVIPRKVKLSKKAWDIYVEMEREFVILTEEGLVTAANAAAATSKLRQIANGSVFASPDKEEDLFDIIANEKREVVKIHDEKAAELVSLLEEHQGRPALIAYEFTHDRTAITQALLKSDMAKFLPKRKGKAYVPFIGGGTADKEADRLIDAWNAGELAVLLGHPASIGHGLNLQDTYASVVYYSLTYNLELYEQFYRRVWRKGQVNTTYLFQILAEDTVDEDVALALEGKAHSQAALLKAMQERTRRQYH